MKTARDMKREGVQKGVPDLMLAVPMLEDAGITDGKYVMLWQHGLFIEMKSERGRLTPEQKDYIEILTEYGYATAVCKSFDEFKATIENYLGN